MKHLYLLLFIGYCSYAQQSLPYEPRSYQYEESEAQQAEDYMRKHLKSPLHTDTISKMSFQEKMNTLNDDKFNFEEYNVKPEEVYNELSNGELEPVEQPEIMIASTENKPEKSEASKYIGMVFGLFCVFLTFIVLLFTKRTKRF